MKSFVKWAGGKGKLLHTLEANLPPDLKEQNSATYIEPFVGSGAMLFHMIEKFHFINRFIINNINPALINCYRKIRDQHEDLINELQEISNLYFSLSTLNERKELFYSCRKQYNSIPVNERTSLKAAALFIFLNKTCFNGLYRENSKGDFNVPYGRYTNPNICNATLLSEMHNVLQNVEIMRGTSKFPWKSNQL